MTVVEFERRRRGLSQTQLAEAAGVTQAEISKIERRILAPRAVALDRLSATLGVPREALVFTAWAEAMIPSIDGEVTRAG